MSVNFNWRSALREAIKVFLFALLGGTGTYLGLNHSNDAVETLQTVVAISPATLG